MWEMLLQTALSVCTSEDPWALDTIGPAWDRDWTMPYRANVAQQKGWEKQKASQGQSPPAKMTLGTGDCPGQPEPRTHSVEPAADTWHPFPHSVIPHTQPSSLTGRINRDGFV